MTDREQYTPGPASGAQVLMQMGWVSKRLPDFFQRVAQFSDENERPPLRPFRRRWEPRHGWSHGEAHHLGSACAACSETTVARADAPKVLEYNWGSFDMRWELEALGGGTRLTLWTHIDRRFTSMGAAGWHICFDVLEPLLAGQPIGRVVGPEAVKFGGGQRLNAEYAKQFDIETSNWPSQAAQKS